MFVSTRLWAFDKVQAVCKVRKHSARNKHNKCALRTENQRAAACFYAFHKLPVCGTWVR